MCSSFVCSRNVSSNGFVDESAFTLWVRRRECGSGKGVSGSAHLVSGSDNGAPGSE